MTITTALDQLIAKWLNEADALPGVEAFDVQEIALRRCAIELRGVIDAKWLEVGHVDGAGKAGLPSSLARLVGAAQSIIAFLDTVDWLDDFVEADAEEAAFELEQALEELFQRAAINRRDSAPTEDAVSRMVKGSD